MQDTIYHMTLNWRFILDFAVKHDFSDFDKHEVKDIVWGAQWLSGRASDS